MKRTLEYGLVGDVIWYVGASGRLDKGEWNAFTSFVRSEFNKPHKAPIRAWAVGYGTGPDALQRKALLDAVGDHDVLVAVNTDSLIAHGAILTLSWFKPNFRAFDIDNRLAAAQHLMLDSGNSSRVLAILLAAEERLRTHRNL